MTEEQAGFEIDGTTYPVPTLDDLTLNEERILYIYSDTVISDFTPAHPDADADEKREVLAGWLRRIRNPEFKRALVHIAYKRVHPDVDDSEIQSAIGEVNAQHVDLELLRRSDSPPDQSSQTPLENGRSSNGPSSSSDSGSPIGSGSGAAAVSLARTGTSG